MRGTSRSAALITGVAATRAEIFTRIRRIDIHCPVPSFSVLYFGLFRPRRRFMAAPVLARAGGKQKPRDNPVRSMNLDRQTCP